MLFTMKWLSEIFSTYRGEVNMGSKIIEVTTDSRKKMNKALFIPLIGDNFNGHDYVQQAYDNGAIAVLWDENEAAPDFLPADFSIFYVPNTLEALQELAFKYRSVVDPIVIGITGSNGKTTTKDIVASVLKTSYKTHCTKGNFNNHIGLPLTILEMPRTTEVLVLEMGMSDFKEIENLSKIAHPDYAIITNIGESHLEFLGSREGIATAKLEIRAGMNETSYLIIDGDEELLLPIHEQKKVITCGFDVRNNVIIEDVAIFHHKTTFKLASGVQYEVPLLGKHHAQNATYAITLAKQLGISNEKIRKGLLALELTGMRFELLKGSNGVSIINDAYNASPTSMSAAIEVIKQMDDFKEKLLVLGDIFELGDQSEVLHMSVANVIEAPITTVFTYGKAAEAISLAVEKKQMNIVCKHFNSKADLLSSLQPYLKETTLILFKASRGMKFELIIEKIQ